MSPSHPRTPRQVINFSKQKGKEIIANFDGGLITSDAGIVWMAELEKNWELPRSLVTVFKIIVINLM